MDIKHELITNPEEAFNYPLILEEIEHGDLELLKKWEDKIPEALRLHFYENCYSGADFYKKPKIIHHLLMHVDRFAYIEKYWYKYNAVHILPFIDEKLLELKKRKQVFENMNQGLVFDLTEKVETRYCFCMLRHLIRRNKSSMYDDIAFLLDIPAVKALIPTEVTPGLPNELMNVALAANNKFAEKMIFDILSVHFIDEEKYFSTIRRLEQNPYFDYLIYFAKEKNKDALEYARKKNYYDYSSKNGYFPDMFLAENGDYESVHFLIETLQLTDRSSALWYYAKGGHSDRVDYELSLGTDPYYAVVGYLTAGHFEKANEIKEVAPSVMLVGYASGCFVQQANSLIAKGVSPASANYGYAREGYFRQVNQQIAAGTKKQLALEGYHAAGYLQIDNLLCLMVVTDDDAFRKNLAEEAKKMDDDIDIENLYQHATRLNKKFNPQQECNKAELFNTIYQYAKNRNEKALNEMVKNGIFLGFYHGKYNVIRLLAKEGQDEAVDFLIDKFLGNLNDAVKGYAEAGLHERVNFLLAEGATLSEVAVGYLAGGFYNQVEAMPLSELNKGWIITSYARKGEIKRVNKWIECDKDKAYAVYGYILGGYFDEAKKLMLESDCKNDAVEAFANIGETEEVNTLIEAGASRDFAISGWSRKGNIKEVNLQIEQGGDRKQALINYCLHGHINAVDQQLLAGADRDLVASFYAAGENIEQVNKHIKAGADKQLALEGYIQSYFFNGHIGSLMKLLIHTEDIELRILLAKKAGEKNNALIPEVLLAKVEKINKLKDSYHLSDKEALCWVEKPQGFIWILQGVQLVHNKTISSDLFWLITQVIFNLSLESTKKIATEVRNYYFPNRIKNNFFTPEKEEAHKKAPGELLLQEAKIL